MEKIITNPTGAHTLPYIEISPEQAKGTSARLITIQPNLLKWIETVPESKRVGFIIPSDFDGLMNKFRLEAGIKGKRNIIRHSFGAYHFHRWSNQGKTMKEMGHTKMSTFMKHYYAWNPEEDAPYLYWELLPEGAEKEPKIVESQVTSPAGHPPHAFTGDGFRPPEMPFNQLNEYWPLMPLNARS